MELTTSTDPTAPAIFPRPKGRVNQRINDFVPVIDSRTVTVPRIP